MAQSTSNQGDVILEVGLQLSVTGISVFKDEKYTTQDVKKVEILDFGDEGFLLNNLLTTEECHHIINEGEQIGFKPIEAYSLDYRNSQRIMLKSFELSKLLFDRALPYLKDVVIDGDPLKQHVQGIELKGTWSPIGLNEVWRLCRYNPGGHFGPHFDGHFARSVSERSLQTFMIYLNADFNGGTTNFVDEKQIEELYMNECERYRAAEKNILFRLQPLEGQAIIFNHHRLHEGGKLLDGVKYILRSDVMYKRSDGQAFTEKQ